MCTQWIVLFDTEGLDSLIPWGDLMGDKIIGILSGEEYEHPNNILNRTLLRARYNLQRHPEVWAYNTADDMDADAMHELWIESPQYMANLVRTKGSQLFGDRSGTKKQPVIV
jgi:hypothetical protein